MFTRALQSSGVINVHIGGTTVGAQYRQLAVANGTSLKGTLNINVINNFVPAIGTILHDPGHQRADWAV